MPVVDEYFPFDTGHGSTSNTARWRKMARLWQSDGVYAGYMNQLNGTLAAGTLTVDTGAVFICGYYGEVQTAQPIPITGTGTGTVVAGVNFSTQQITIYYRDGITDYGTGGYEQDTSVWEIPLWLVSGTSVTDLRTMINPGAGDGWWSTVAGPITVATSTTVQTNFLTPRVPYTGQAILRGELLLTYSDLSQLQTVPCTLTYQFGQSDQQVTPTITPGVAGGGPVGGQRAVVVTISGLIPVTQGKKTVGWRVTASTGPQVTIATLTAQLQMINLPAAA